MVAKARAALDQARREHEEKVSAIEAERAALDERAQAEDTRWEMQREKLNAVLRRARE
jgi:colicin import membrane protein